MTRNRYYGGLFLFSLEISINNSYGSQQWFEHNQLPNSLFVFWSFSEIRWLCPFCHLAATVQLFLFFLISTTLLGIFPTPAWSFILHQSGWQHGVTWQTSLSTTHALLCAGVIVKCHTAFRVESVALCMQCRSFFRVNPDVNGMSIFPLWANSDLCCSVNYKMGLNRSIPPRCSQYHHNNWSRVGAWVTLSQVELSSQGQLREKHWEV